MNIFSAVTISSAEISQVQGRELLVYDCQPPRNVVAFNQIISRSYKSKFKNSEKEKLNVCTE